VAVAANVVDVEVVRQAHLADVELQSPFGHLGSEGKRCSRAFNHFVSESDGLVELCSGHVRNGTEIWIADYVQIGEPGKTKCLAEASAASRLKVEDGVGFSLWVGPQLCSKVKRAEQRGLVLTTAYKAVRAFIGGVKRPIGLKDNVGLPGDEKTRVFPVWKHGRRSFVRWRGRIGELRRVAGVSIH